MRAAHLRLVLLVGVLASPARAAEVVRALDGDVVIEANGFYKAAATGALLPDGLVEASEALAALTDDVRALLPPDVAADIEPVTPLPRGAIVVSNTVRLAARATLWSDFDVAAAWQATQLSASAPVFVQGGARLFGAAPSSAKRRLVDLPAYLVEARSGALQHNLDQLSVAWHSSFASIVVGRQVLSWGAGHLWNPTDVFSPFSPTDVDREVRRGADAARVSIPLGEVSELDVLWLPQLRLGDNGALARARTNVFDVDLSALAGKVAGDVVLGADAAGDVGPAQLYAEASWTLPLPRAVVRTQGLGDEDDWQGALDDAFARAVAGIVLRPAEPWFVVVEYYYNGFGAADAKGVLDKLRSARAARGEMFGAERHYLGATSSWTLTDQWTLSATSIVNLTDPGLLAVLATELSIDPHVLLRVAATAPFSAGVAASEIERLTPLDVLGETQEARRALRTFGAQSEYGLSPATVFVQLGGYFG